MAVFLINDKQVHSYEQLLAEINGSQSYYPLSTSSQTCSSISPT